jgi:isoaspartyl peptidase/L-asparaginase-like protein (Ntn-hydrolase superfamily)
MTSSTQLDGRARLDAAISDADSSLAKAIAALEGLKTSGADALKNMLVDLDARLKRLKETQDAFAAPLHRRKG